MFLLDCLLLAAFVYVLPALAVFPRLMLSPKTVFGIPIVSVAVVYLIVTVLKALQLYNNQTVLVACLLVGGLAAVRGRKTIIHHRFHWTRQDVWLWGFLIALMMPYFIKLGVEAFEQGDEIYSWNFWGLQHYFQEALDFSHTSATYPQLFPKLISFCYHVLGDIQLQCPTKAMLGMFPLAMLGAWASMMMSLTPRRWVYFLITVGYVVGGLKLEQFFNDGYADPIMTSALVVSMAFILMAFENRKPLSSKSLVLLGCVSAGVACFTKQPALMWLIAILPLLLIIQAYRLNQAWLGLAALGCVSLAVFWLFTEGNQFYNNQGVVYLSFEGRGWFEQLIHVGNRYLIQKPLLLTLILGAGFVTRKHKIGRFIFWAFVVPQLLLWLMFGAYQLRLGQHVIAVSTLLLLVGLKHQPYPLLMMRKISHSLIQYRGAWLKGMATLSSVACVGLLAKAWYVDKPGVDFTQGGRVSLQRYFGSDSQKVYDTIYQDSQALLWVPTRYIYGIFYKHTQLTSPDYALYQPYNEQALIDELRCKQPDYVFTVSPEVIDGVASQTLERVINKCPSAFEVFATPPNKYNYTTYRVNHETLAQDQCLNSLG